MDGRPVSEDFTIDWVDGIGLFTITRPRRLNAATRAVMQGLSAALDEAEGGRARLLIVTGEGERSFCAGTDLAESQGLTPEQVDAKSNFARGLMVRLARSPITSIAALNGLAFGGGLEIAMACTMRVAAAHASVALPEIKLGVLPSYGGTQLLPPLIGRARALDMMMTGRTVPAAEALAIGLVDRVAAEGTPVLDDAMALARLLGGYSATALAALRRCVAAAGDTLTDTGIAVEAEEVARIPHSADAKEGIAAFLEKRPPVFNRA